MTALPNLTPLISMFLRKTSTYLSTFYCSEQEGEFCTLRASLMRSIHVVTTNTLFRFRTSTGTQLSRLRRPTSTNTTMHQRPIHIRSSLSIGLRLDISSEARHHSKLTVLPARRAIRAGHRRGGQPTMHAPHIVRTDKKVIVPTYEGTKDTELVQMYNDKRRRVCDRDTYVFTPFNIF